MDKKSLGINFDLTFQRIQNLNPSFDLARVAIAYHGLNRNKSVIDKEVFNKALPSLYNIPLVGRYIPESEDFGSHDLMVTVDEEGKYKLENATVPFGVIPESSDISWENVTEEDGTEREYLFANCVLWKRSYGYETLISQDKWSQSMEIQVNDYEVDKNDCMVIKDMTFTALCILGNDVEPCFESASVQFGMNEDRSSFSSQFSLMIDDFKELTKQAVCFEFSGSDDGLSNEEGGERDLMTEEMCDSILAEFNMTIEDIDFDYSEMTEEEFRSCFAKVACEEVELDAEEPAIELKENVDFATTEESFESCEEVEPVPKVGSEKFSYSYEQKRKCLYRALENIASVTTTVTGEIESETCYYLYDFDDRYVYVEKYVWTSTNRSEENGRFEYSIDEFENASVGVYEKMIVKWLTLEEDAMINAERQELVDLRGYKADRVRADHCAEIDNLVESQFADITSTEEFDKLRETIYDLDVESVEEKLFAIRGKHTIVKAAKEPNNQSVRIPVEAQSSKGNTNMYGDLFGRFAKKH